MYWHVYSHKLLYPLWLVQGCGLFPNPSLSHKVQVCLPPGTLLPMWSVCTAKFKDHFNYLAQYYLHSELVCLNTNISEGSDGLQVHVTLVHVMLHLIIKKQILLEWMFSYSPPPHISKTKFVAVGESAHLNTQFVWKFYEWKHYFTCFGTETIVSVTLVLYLCVNVTYSNFVNIHSAQLQHLKRSNLVLRISNSLILTLPIHIITRKFTVILLNENYSWQKYIISRTE